MTPLIQSTTYSTNFPWKLNKNDFKTSIFLKQKTREYANRKKVLGFIASNMGVTYMGNRRYDYLCMKYSTELDQIKTYKNNYNRKDNYFNTSYYLPAHKWGRCEPVDTLSLSKFRRSTRHALSKDIYRDIDMMNCQVVIVYDIAKKNGVACNETKNYIDNCKEYRQSIMEHHQCDKDTAKQLPIRLMMGGSYNQWIKDFDIGKNILPTETLQWVKNIQTEMSNVMNYVVEQNPMIEKDVLKQNKDKWTNVNEKRRGIMALWCQSIERLLQETVISYLVSEKHFILDDIVPCQDGFMILKELWYDTIIEDCNAVIRKQFDLSVVFCEKEFDEACEITDYEEEKPISEWEDSLSSKTLADSMLVQWKDNFVLYQSNLYVFWTEDNRWYCEATAECRFKLTLYISEKLYNLYIDKIDNAVELSDKDKTELQKKLRSMTSSKKNIADIVNMLLPNVSSNKLGFDYLPHLLGFENGVFDLKLNQFRQYKQDDFMTLSCQYDYTACNDNKLIEDVNSILDGIQEDPLLKKYLLQIFASGLDGNLYQFCHLFNGKGGNGKSLLSKWMRLLLGDYFSQPPNSLLTDLQKSNQSSSDLLGLKNKRYVLWTECEGDLNGAIIKKLTGGDSFKARALYGNPQEFAMQATIGIEFNKPPELTDCPDDAIVRRARFVPFSARYTSNEDMIGKTVNGITYRKAIPEYLQDDYIIQHRAAFLHILLGIYKASMDTKTFLINFDVPHVVVDKTKTFINEQNLFNMAIMNEFEIGESSKVVRFSDVWNVVSYNQEFKEAARAKRGKGYGKTAFYEFLRENYDWMPDSSHGDKLVGLKKKEYAIDTDE